MGILGLYSYIDHSQFKRYFTWNIIAFYYIVPKYAAF